MVRTLNFFGVKKVLDLIKNSYIVVIDNMKIQVIREGTLGNYTFKAEYRYPKPTKKHPEQQMIAIGTGKTVLEAIGDLVLHNSTRLGIQLKNAFFTE